MGRVKTEGTVRVVLYLQYVMTVLPSAAGSTRGAEVIVAQALPDILSCGIVLSGKGWSCSTIFEEGHLGRLSPSRSFHC